MKLLILGGTVFLGRHLVEAALAREDEITLFNRGLDNPGLFPEVEKLRGDRDGDLKALEGHTWDAVIDTCGYFPSHVRDTARLLADSVDHYTFISTIGVYEDFDRVGMDETAPVARVADERLEELTAETYGGLKALCESTLEACMPGRSLSVRAGLIVGPFDPLERFTYWARRTAEGGEVLAPGGPERRVQIIDARDAAEWILRMIESRSTGIYNCTGPDYHLTMGRVLEESIAVGGADTRLIWVDDKFLIEQKVGAWQEIPLWLPQDHPKVANFTTVDCGKAISSGLSFRPLRDTIRDTLTWDQGRTEPPVPYKLFGIELPPAGLDRERERELLRRWKERQAAGGHST